MDELVQDLATALDDPSLKHDIDDAGDLSASDMKMDRDVRKRKMRKRKTTNTNGTSSTINHTSASQLNNSPKSSSSLDEGTKDYRYVESHTANCSEESDECAHSWQSTFESSILPSRIHHKRVFKQAYPCHCESDSHTENVPAVPRKHRKKRQKRMIIDNSILGQRQDGSVPESCDLVKKFVRRREIACTEMLNGFTPMNCEPTKTKRESRNALACIDCHKKSCDRLLSQRSVNLLSDAINGDFSYVNGNANSRDDTCHCQCHTTLGKDESSLSGSSSNSDTDSANYTYDGGDGDDEMTDFYAETDGGPVFGVPNIQCVLRLGQTAVGSKGEGEWSCELNDFEIGSSSFTLESKAKRFVQGTSTGYHSRLRFPGFAARSVRRGRRRAKMKKTRDKNLREHDVNSFSKLSLSARSKRIRLDGYREGVHRIDWASSQKSFMYDHGPLPEVIITKPSDSTNKEDMDVFEEAGCDSNNRLKPPNISYS